MTPQRFLVRAQVRCQVGMPTLQWNAASENAKRKRWAAFPSDLQGDIDHAFKTFLLNEEGNYAVVGIAGKGYRLDFQQKVQINVETGYTRELRWHVENEKDPNDHSDVFDAKEEGTMLWDASSGNGNKRRWRPYPPELQPQIDAAFMRQRGRGAIGVTMGNSEYVLNFDEMRQIKVATGFTRKIKWGERPKGECAMGAADAGNMLRTIKDAPYQGSWADQSEEQCDQSA